MDSLTIFDHNTTMCGICGILSPSSADASIRAMAEALDHRGPDDSGEWQDEGAGIALGHRRLSILDLSSSGHQPMESACGRYVIAYNGEAYNHLGLRAELEASGQVFRGTSDTETLLAAVSRWGVRPAVERLVGMFAFALWDKERRELILVRDRLGIKPLFYGMAGRDFVFGSELKSLAAHPAFRREVDRNALALFFRHDYIPAPHTIFEGVRKLIPGTILTVKQGREPVSETYWSAESHWDAGLREPFSGTMDEAVEALDALIAEAVRSRLLSDVPLGAFLSGGIDSSLVVAAMQCASASPVKTFTIGFAEASHDEAAHARAIAEHLGTDHTELTVAPGDLLGVVPDIPSIWDEPFSDPSQVPTLLLSQLTRKHVTVSLSGDGGDELFAGYTRYLEGVRHQGLLGLPQALRSLAGSVAATGIFGRRTADRFKALASRRFADLYQYMVSHHKQSASLVLHGREPETVFSGHAGEGWGNAIHQMTWLDTATYLPDDILTKLDRASMAVSLEARVPLLDHRVVEFAARLPVAMKTDGTTGKLILRRVLERYVPRHLFERPKQGFGMPVGRWLRGELREWAGDLLSEDSIRGQGFLNADEVTRMWLEHQSGKRDFSYCLWDMLMFRAWADRWLG